MMHIRETLQFLSSHRGIILMSGNKEMQME